MQATGESGAARSGETPGWMRVRVLGGPEHGKLLADPGEFRPADGALPWILLQRDDPRTSAWLEQSSGLGEAECEALLEETPHPRIVLAGDALLVVLRGVNLNPGEEPEDMVSVRMWLQPDKVLTIYGRSVLAIEDLVARLSAGLGPRSAEDFLSDLASDLVERLEPVCNALDDQMDELEELIVAGETQTIRTRLGALRRQFIELRRHVAPQRDTLARLWREPVSWIDDENRRWLHETADELARVVEHIDELRERAVVTQEELTTRVSEQLNMRLLVLALITAVFLPLHLVTGLLGANVGGIPGASSPAGFFVVCAVLVLLVALEVILLRRLRWM